MADCRICGGVVETHNYIRAKAMIASDERDGRVIYKAAPSDEHLFFGLDAPQYKYEFDQLSAMCQGHSLESISARIEEELKPSSNQPVRLLFNPSTGHLQLKLRRQRITRNLDELYGSPGTDEQQRRLRTVMIQFTIDEEDKRRNVEVVRNPGEQDGLRFATVMDSKNLLKTLVALQGEPELIGG